MCTHRTPQKNRERAPDIAIGNDFLYLTPKAKAVKAKINKGTLIELKILFRAKETDKMERQPMEWEKIFANQISGKGLIPKI